MTWVSAQKTCQIPSGSILVTASYGHYSQYATRIRLDCMCWIWFPTSVSALFFLKKTWIMLCKADPYLIWMAWSGFGQTHVVSDRMQLAHYQFINFQTQLCSSTQVPDHVGQNWPRSSLVLADYQVLAKCIWSRSKPVGKNHLARFWPMLPSLSKSDPACLLGVFLQPRKPTDKGRART